MSKSPWTAKEKEFVLQQFEKGVRYPVIRTKLREEFGVDRSVDSLNAFINRTKYNESNNSGLEESKPGFDESLSWKETRQRDSWVIECNDSRISTVEDALKKANVDTTIWTVEKVYIGGWDVTMKLKSGNEEKPFRSQNQQLKVVLRRLVPEKIEDAVERLLERVSKKSPKVQKIKHLSIEKLPHRRSLELCLADPHYGMRCFKPGADQDWTPELCAEMVMDTFQELVSLAKVYGPFEEVVLPFGNDFFHSDNIWQTTTAGTLQPEADAYHHTFIGGETLAIQIIDTVKTLAPVFLYAIPGNHDRTTSFMLGRVLRAWYKNDENVTVYADESPYKFHRYGCNLIGYEHGHSIPGVRLAAIMANECPEHWYETKNGYREWHLGDQHRKGSSKPSSFEEQGVSVEYLPSLTPPNEWHKLKGYNWQKRATMAFVWDYSAGPIARLQVNVDNRLNQIMGRTTAK